MTGELDILWNILWAFGGFIFGVVGIILLFIFTENVIKVKFLNMVQRGAYGLIEVMTDNQQVVTKVINKLNERQTKVLDNVFSIDKSGFLLKDGISVIHYHYSNCLQPASWRAYDEIKIIYMVPTAVKVMASIPVPGDKTGAKPPIQQEVYLYGEQMTPFQLPSQEEKHVNEKGETVTEMVAPPLWTKINEKTLRYEAIAKPSEFASLVKANETEMEANAVLLRQKQLEKLAMWVMIAAAVSVFSFIVSILIAYWLNQTNGSVGAMGASMNAMNTTIGELAAKNVTVSCGPTLITP